ncbi:mucin-22-like [Palaemon carinicauda]|uniref:mucin-22-like n=1 Tax=Palaemon carinicauda TaxID=392227 RepID=UPI0035B59BA7
MESSQTSTSGSSHTTSTSTMTVSSSTTETTATTSITSSSTTESTTATTTSTPTTSTATSTLTSSTATSTLTSSTTTTSTSSSTTTVPPQITIEDLSLEADKKIEDGSAMKECWDRGMILYTAYTTQEFDDLRALLIASSFASENVLVGVQNRQWTDFYGFTRSPESSEWTADSTSDSCAYLSISDDFKLKATPCSTSVRLLCMKLPTGCLRYKQVAEASVEVALCKKLPWDQGDDLCWENGGRFYTADTSSEMTSMATHWGQNDDNYIDKLWVGERAGRWTVTGRETVNAEWKGSDKKTADKCGSLEGDDYLLQEKNCDENRNVLCKKHVCVSGYEMIPGIGCSTKVGPSPWDQGSQFPCTDNGGGIYEPADSDELDMLIEYLNTESSSFNEDMWIKATNTDASNWLGSIIPTLSSTKCGYLSKDNDFLLRDEDCSQQKAILCRIPRTPIP